MKRLLLVLSTALVVVLTLLAVEQHNQHKHEKNRRILARTESNCNNETAAVVVQRAEEEDGYTATGFCARVPADRSAGYLWKGMPASSPPPYRKGIRGQPRQWGVFLNGLELAIETGVPVEVLVVTDGSFPDLHEWSLQNAIAGFLGPFSSKGEDVLLTTRGVNVTTVPLSSIKDVVSHRLDEQEPPHLVLFASTGSDQKTVALDEVVECQARYRSQIQEALEQIYKWTTTAASSEQHNCSMVPPIVLWDISEEELNSNSDDEELKVASSLRRRVSQQVADHHQFGYLARLAESTMKDHVVLLQFGLLEYTVNACSSQALSQQQPELLLSKLLPDASILKRMERAPMPRIDGATSLVTISRDWEFQENTWC